MLWLGWLISPSLIWLAVEYWLYRKLDSVCWLTAAGWLLLMLGLSLLWQLY